MIDDLLRTLVHSRNRAADDVLVDALRLGTVHEQTVILGALLARKSVNGLMGVIEHYDKLAEPLQLEILQSIKDFHSAIREAGRSNSPNQRLGAIKLVAQGRQGKLSYVLSENLHSGDERFSKAAAGAMTALSRWIWRSLSQLNWGEGEDGGPLIASDGDLNHVPTRAALYQQVIENRREIEQAVVRALELHRGSRQQELMHAALMLCDSAQSSSIAILTTAKHAGQAAMLRRIQQSPEPEHVSAWLLGATHGALRAGFGVAFAKIDQPIVLDQLLKKSHWLVDHALQLCMKQVQGGAWLREVDLTSELGRRSPRQIAAIGQWVAATGVSELQQDRVLERLLTACGDDVDARLKLLRIAIGRDKLEGVAGSSELLVKLLRDSDERIVRMAVRELIRRKPADFESALLPLMSDAPASIRKIISRAIGQASFESYWAKFDTMDPTRRKSAGTAMMKLLPDAVHRLARKLSTGTIDERIKGMQMLAELDLILSQRQHLLPLCSHPNSKVRSKAVTLLGNLGVPAVDVLIEKAAADADDRVRANAVEAMEQRGSTRFVPILIDRAKSGHNCERANAIKALHSMKVGVAGPQLMEMLKDNRPEHRMSGLWLLRRIGWWRLLQEVAAIARQDDNIRVRRYALGVLQAAAVELKPRKAVA
jgi:HEAT repeat protein